MVSSGGGDVAGLYIQRNIIWISLYANRCDIALHRYGGDISMPRNHCDGERDEALLEHVRTND